MKACLLYTLFIPVLFSACNSTPNFFIEDLPKIDEKGVFLAHGFYQSTCLNKDKNIHLIMDDQLFIIDPKKLMNANIAGESPEQRTENVDTLLASENIESLGCAENPFPAGEIWITKDTDLLSLNSPFDFHAYKIEPITQITKDNHGFIAQATKAANQSSNCEVTDGHKTCQSVEPKSANNAETSEFIYRSWVNNPTTLHTGEPYTERCTFYDKAKEAKANDEFEPIAGFHNRCFVRDTLPTHFMFTFYYYDNTPQDRIKGLSLYQTYIDEAIRWTQK